MGNQNFDTLGAWGAVSQWDDAIAQSRETTTTRYQQGMGRLRAKMGAGNIAKGSKLWTQAEKRMGMLETEDVSRIDVEQQTMEASGAWQGLNAPLKGYGSSYVTYTGAQNLGFEGSLNEYYTGLFGKGVDKEGQVAGVEEVYSNAFWRTSDDPQDISRGPSKTQFLETGEQGFLVFDQKRFDEATAEYAAANVDDNIGG